MIAKRLDQLEASVTLKISAKAKKMKRSGIDVVDFSVGEPDFSTPDPVKEAAHLAIDQNFTHYTQVDGIPELKEVILSGFQAETGLDYRPTEILVSPGAKMSIYLALAALVNPGDEVLIPAPYWVSYPEQVKLVDGIPVIVPTEEKNGFLATPEEIRRALTQRTRVIILNNPSNPTGSLYNKDQLLEILRITTSRKIMIIADEIYSKIIFDGSSFTRIATLGDDIRDLTVTVDGVSKAYSMTGWRIGYAVGPQKVIEAMKKIQGHTTSNPCSISQRAALEAYSGPQEYVKERAQIFEERRNYLWERLNEIPGIRCNKPLGAFYLFPNVSHYFNTSDGERSVFTAVDIADYLLEQAHVATVPGEGFGVNENIRLSFATSMDNLQIGVKRITSALGRLGRI